jgi:predicted phage terminase large subunit-like protein
MAEYDPAALAEAANRELACRHIVELGRRVVPRFEAPPHIVLMCELLERVERGELRKLIITLPPRHAKSTTVSQLFPAYFVGRRPTKNVILSSYGAELAERNSRAARSIVTNDRWPFETRISPDSTAMNRWNVVEGGGIFAIGQGGGVTGRGADCLILDDLAHDSGSEAERDAAWRWYAEVAVPRLEPSAAIIAIGTRFAEDDIFGRILSGPDAHEWTVVRLPAFAEENDLLGRRPGEALWPARVTKIDLNERRQIMGARAFESQFQQNPLPAGGDLFRAEWLQHRYDRAPEDLSVIMALDAASKTGIANDYSAIAVLGSNKTHHYLLDMIRRKVDFPELRRMVIAAFEQWHPSTIYIEDAANAVGLIQELKRETRLPIVAETPKGSKISRMEAQTGLFEAGNVLLPNERVLPAAWLLDFEREILAVPNGKHDDQVDALCIALAHAAKKSAYGISWAKLNTSIREPTRTGPMIEPYIQTAQQLRDQHR